jgi:hypothetical protein
MYIVPLKAKSLKQNVLEEGKEDRKGRNMERTTEK